MQLNYNINQTVLNITTDYIPDKNNTACYINALVERLEVNDPYLFGRPREYDLAAMLKLYLFALTRNVFSSRRIELLAQENLSARWLTQEMMPSYRTIARFRIADDIEALINQSLDVLVAYLRQERMISNAIFIDGTKILANANKYSFVWKKNTIRFDEMNRTAIQEILNELKIAQSSCEIPEGSNLTLEMIEEVIDRLDQRLSELDKAVEATKKLSPNPHKKARRALKSTRRKLSQRRSKMINHQNQMTVYGDRNSYSKTDHDATFMRVKEDPMQNGQLKPTYNLQIATSNQFILGYQLFRRPTDTRTLKPFLETLNRTNKLEDYIVADAGYGSEANYRYIENQLPNQTALIPYGTMLKEQSKKWKSDDRKVMNWDYHEVDDYYLDPHGVRFNFAAYRQRTDRNGITRDFKEYQAEQYDENQNFISAAKTTKGNRRKIQVNGSWEYFKAQQRERLSNSETGQIYIQRKIDVEPVFGRMKACLPFNRFLLRGLKKVNKEMGMIVLALNINKLASLGRA